MDSGAAAVEPSDKSKAKFYVERIKAEARKQVQGPPLSSTRIDVEIIFATRDARDVDNVAKRILDALGELSTTTTSRFERSRTSHSSSLRDFMPEDQQVFQRLLSGKEFLVNRHDKKKSTPS